MGPPVVTMVQKNTMVPSNHKGDDTLNVDDNDIVPTMASWQINPQAQPNIKHSIYCFHVFFMMDLAVSRLSLLKICDKLILIS